MDENVVAVLQLKSMTIDDITAIKFSEVYFHDFQLLESVRIPHLIANLLTRTQNNFSEREGHMLVISISFIIIFNRNSESLLGFTYQR